MEWLVNLRGSLRTAKGTRDVVIQITYLVAVSAEAIKQTPCRKALQTSYGVESFLADTNSKGALGRRNRQKRREVRTDFCQ